MTVCVNRDRAGSQERKRERKREGPRAKAFARLCVSRYAFRRRTHNFSLCKSARTFRATGRGYIRRWVPGGTFRVKTANSTARTPDFLVVASAGLDDKILIQRSERFEEFRGETTPRFSSGQHGMRDRRNARARAVPPRLEILLSRAWKTVEKLLLLSSSRWKNSRTRRARRFRGKNSRKGVSPRLIFWNLRRNNS